MTRCCYTEITAFMTAHKFHADPAYVKGLVDSFAGQEDVDYLTRDDFVEMRKHLQV